MNGVVVEAVNLAEVLDIGPAWLPIGTASVYAFEEQVVESECRRCEVRWVAALAETSCWMCGAVDATRVRCLA